MCIPWPGGYILGNNAPTPPQTLSGTGLVIGNVTAAANAAITVGAPGTLTFRNNLTFAAGFNPAFNVGNSGAGLLQVNGKFTATNGATVTINVLGASLNAGTYTLVSFASGNPTNGFVKTPVFNPAGLTGYITNVTGKVNLVVTGGAIIPPNDSITSVVNNGDGTITLSVNATPNAPFHVITTTNVALPRAQWTAVAGSNGMTAGVDGTASVTVTAATPPQFFGLSFP